MAKIQNGRHFWGEEIFFEYWQEYIFWIPCGSKILTKSRSILHGFGDRHIYEIDIFLYFIFKFKMAAKSGGKAIFVKSRQYSLDTLGVENFDELPLSGTVKEIEANLCFSIFIKNSI